MHMFYRTHQWINTVYICIYIYIHSTCHTYTPKDIFYTSSFNARNVSNKFTCQESNFLTTKIQAISKIPDTCHISLNGLRFWCLESGGSDGIFFQIYIDFSTKCKHFFKIIVPLLRGYVECFRAWSTKQEKC